MRKSIKCIITKAFCVMLVAVMVANIMPIHVRAEESDNVYISVSFDGQYIT